MTEFLKKITKSDIRNILAVISILGAFIIIILLIVKPVPEGNRDTINLALGFVLGGLVGGISGFYFGASKSNTVEKKVEEE